MFREKKETKMKYLFTALMLMLAAATTWAEKPEPVHSIVKEIKPYDWYAGQAELWNLELEKDPKNLDAWLNFYTANRMASLVDFDSFAASEADYLRNLDTILAEVERNIPGTYEAYHIRAWQGGATSAESLEAALKAYELDPSRPDVYDELIVGFEIERNLDRRAEICRAWRESGEYSNDLLNYNYNVLMSVDENAILLTGGDNDTYPVWILQDAFDVRPNVTVINLSLFMIDDYRKNLIASLDSDDYEVDLDKIAEISENRTEYTTNYTRALIDKIIEAAGYRPVYFAASVSEYYYENLKENMYLTGLAFLYSEDETDNFALMRRTFERDFLLDYLKYDFITDGYEEAALRVELNYLPVLLKLAEHYRTAGDDTGKRKVIDLAKIIADRSGRAKEINQWFERIGISLENAK